MSLDDNVNNLKRLTQELAEEIHRDEEGRAFKFIKTLFNNIESFVAVVDDECNIIYINPSAVKFAKDNLKLDITKGDNCLLWIKDKMFCENCIVKNCMNQKKILNEIMISPNTKLRYWRTCIPLVYNGVSGVIEIAEKYDVE